MTGCRPWGEGERVRGRGKGRGGSEIERESEGEEEEPRVCLVHLWRAETPLNLESTMR